MQFNERLANRIGGSILAIAMVGLAIGTIWLIFFAENRNFGVSHNCSGSRSSGFSCSGSIRELNGTTRLPIIPRLVTNAGDYEVEIIIEIEDGYAEVNGRKIEAGEPAILIDTISVRSDRQFNLLISGEATNLKYESKVDLL